MLPHALKGIRDGLLGLIYPQECRVCSGPVEFWSDGVACAHCWDDPSVTKLLTRGVCGKCGAPVSAPPKFATDSIDRLCGMCGTLPFTAARACGEYSGALEASIIFLKSHPHICTRLRGIIRRTISNHSEALASDLVVPVPLHPLRERQRGFNQARIIAKLIASEFDLALDDRTLMRTKPTERHRAGMDAADRAKSVERAFEVAKPRLIEDSSVLLVDDVFTTGSTICAATQALIKSGARQVKVLTIARVGDMRLHH